MTEAELKEKKDIAEACHFDEFGKPHEIVERLFCLSILREGVDTAASILGRYNRAKLLFKQEIDR